MPVMSVAEFFQVLEKSALLPADQCQLARQQFAAESDPKNVARRLLAEGRITKWQAKQLLHGRAALTIGPYRLLDQVAGDDVTRVFLAQHSQSGQQIELRSLSRSQTADRPTAIQEFIEAAEKLAAAESRKLLEVHRPQSQEDACYVTLEAPVGGVVAAAASASSDSTFEVERAKAEQTPAAGSVRPGESKSGESKSGELPAVQVTPKAAVGEVRPPKLKPKAKPAGAASAAAGVAASQSKPAPVASSKPGIEIKLPGQDGPAGAGGASPGFKIATGKRRKKPGAAAAGAGASGGKTADAAGEEQGAAKVSRRGLSPALILGGAVGGGGLLTAIVVVAWLLLSGGDDSQVADAGRGPAAAKAAKEPAGGGKEAAKPAAVEPEARSGSEPGDPVVDPVVVVEAAPAEASGAKPETPPVGAGPAPNAAKAPQTAKSPPALATEAPPTAAPPEAKSADAAEPAKSEPSAAVAPVAQTEASPEPAAQMPEASPAPGPETGKPQAGKPAAPPPGKKPFADLADFAALPDVTAADGAQPKTLGRVYIPAGELCFIKLRGGEKALRGTQQFAMKNAQGGVAEREWEISLREGPAGSETALASLAVDDQFQLVFRWSPEAKSQELAPYLCNCVFSLSCAGESKAVILRQPVQVEALAVDFDKPTSKDDWKIDLCPNPEGVKFEITGVQGAKSAFDPAGPQAAEKASVWVRIEDGGGLLSLKLDASLKRDFQLLATPHIKAPEAAKPDKFVRRVFQDGLKKASLVSEQYNQRVKMTQEYAKTKAPDAKQAEQRLPVWELEARNQEALVQNMKQIETLLKSLEGGMKIQFRVFFDADTTEVDLLKVGN